MEKMTKIISLPIISKSTVQVAIIKINHKKSLCINLPDLANTDRVEQKITYHGRRRIHGAGILWQRYSPASRV